MTGGADPETLDRRPDYDGLMGLFGSRKQTAEHAFERSYSGSYLGAWAANPRMDPVDRHCLADLCARRDSDPNATPEQLDLYELTAFVNHLQEQKDSGEYGRRVLQRQWRVCFLLDFDLARAAAEQYAPDPLVAAAWTFRWCSTHANTDATLLHHAIFTSAHKTLLDESIGEVAAKFGVDGGCVFDWLLKRRPEVTVSDCAEQMRLWALEPVG